MRSFSVTFSSKLLIVRIPVFTARPDAIFDAEDTAITRRNEPSFLVWRRWRKSTVVGRRREIVSRQLSTVAGQGDAGAYAGARRARLSRSRRSSPYA